MRPNDAENPGSAMCAFEVHLVSGGQHVTMGAGTRTDMMATGTVKWFNATKGFGFIQPEGGSKDVFVHISAVQAAGLSGLNDGQRVSYEVQMERGKESAGNLKLA
jgi:CspA family cold shock protein